VSAKDLAIDVVRSLPDDTTFEVILEEIAILAAIRRGESAIEAGRVVPHEEIKKRLATWLSK
jgi:predicted transcriptional regulator